jgi:hypothetical protein
MSLLPEYNLPETVARLVKFCEKVCDRGCCGIDAFDFSPLHVASYISAITGGMRDCDIAEWDERLAEVERATQIIEPNDDGFVCYIPNINHAFSRSLIEALIAEIRHSIRSAPVVVALSNHLASDTPVCKLIEDDWQRSQRKIQHGILPAAFVKFNWIGFIVKVLAAATICSLIKRLI